MLERISKLEPQLAHERPHGRLADLKAFPTQDPMNPRGREPLLARGRLLALGHEQLAHPPSDPVANVLRSGPPHRVLAGNGLPAQVPPNG